MERAKARVRYCLLLVVLLAAVLGLIDSVGYRREKTVKEEGTLVKQEGSGWERTRTHSI